jgi:hypothetical protein
VHRFFGGPEFQQLIGATIRSVTSGILGVALIQSVLAGLGFFFNLDCLVRASGKGEKLFSDGRRDRYQDM